MFNKIFKKNNYRLSNRLHFIKNIDDINTNDTKLFKINCEYCDTTKNLFKYFAEQLEFPDYFGKNWDAFDECLWDMGWIKRVYKKSSVDIYIYNMKKLLINETDKEDRGIFCNIINRDYIVNKNNEDDLIQFPVDINIYIPESNRKFYIENNSVVIWETGKID